MAFFVKTNKPAQPEGELVRRLLHRFSVLSLAFLSFFPATAVFGQSAGNKDSLQTYYGEELRVIGLRGERNLLKLPLAASVIQAKDFAATRKMGLNDALKGVPGVFAQSRSGGQDVRLTVRGFGARGSGDRSNSATMRGLKVLVDGIPETEPDGRTALDLVDLSAADKIEVVRSNASMLFGNASGGIINIESRTGFPKSFVENSTSGGSFGLEKNNLAAGLTLGSGRLFVSGTRTLFDGWRKHSNSMSTQLNAVFLSHPDPSTRLKVMAGGGVNNFRIPGALTQAQFDADPTQANATYVTRDERRYNRTGKLAFNLSRNLTGRHSIEVLGFVAPKVLQRSERNTFRDFNRYHLGGGAVWSWNQRTDGSGLKLSSGLDAAYQDGSILFYRLTNGVRGDSLRTNKREGAGSYGFFAQGEVPVKDKFSVVLGGRYDYQLYLAENYAAGANGGQPKERLKFNHWTPKAALLYRVSDSHSIYAQVGGGVEVPAFNEVDPPPTLPNVQLNSFLKPMSSTTVETGAKGLLDWETEGILHSLAYDFAGYWIQVRNEVVPFNGGEWFFTAGKSRRYGFEAGARAELAQGISLRSALTFLDAKYVKYSNELGDFSGKRVPGIPKTIFNGSARYEPGFGGRVEVGLEHAGYYYADDANTVWTPPYTIFNSSVGYEVNFSGLQFEGFLGVNNLTDKKYAGSAFINPVNSGGSLAFLEPGLPRNYFGGIQLHLVP